MRERQGAGLAEILMAVALLATILLALVRIFPTAYAASDQSGDVMVATHLGQAWMDREMARPFDQLANLPVSNETLTGNSRGALVQRVFTVSVQVQRPNADRARITVSVQWKQSSGDLPRVLRIESTRVRP
jgi:Tfp pilus assembly protein PilV